MYDPTMKKLIDLSAPDWVRWLQKHLALPPGDFAVESPNVSTTADADRVFRCEGSPPYLLNLEFESQWRAERPERFLKYSVLLSDKTGLPVCTVVLLICKEANSSDLTGLFERSLNDAVYLQWRYIVIKAWEVPTKEFLTGGIGLLPFAPMSATTEDELPSIIRTMDERFREVAPTRVYDLFMAAGVLMGLRFSDKLIEDLMNGVMRMENSSFYQMIRNKGLNEGRNEQRIVTSRDFVLELGVDRFGEPNELQRGEIERIEDAERLHRMVRQVAHSTSWDELFQVK